MSHVNCPKRLRLSKSEGDVNEHSAAQYVLEETELHADEYRGVQRRGSQGALKREVDSILFGGVGPKRRRKLLLRQTRNAPTYGQLKNRKAALRKKQSGRFIQAYSSMDFIFGLPPDVEDRTGVLVFVDRFTKMVYLIPVSDTATAAETAAHFIHCISRYHGLPESIVSDRDPRFTSPFWSSLFQLLGTKLSMSTAAHLETDGKTERVNRVLEDVLRSYATSFASWSSFLPLAEFALNNAEHALTGLTPTTRAIRACLLLSLWATPRRLVAPLWVGMKMMRMT
ncbi:hypothetical protein PF005_g21085 [Phytophthora fragariae]|uniref:Integrase catalytic domain-containing protein n=2 Tax=Phytophthora fragariae TaxID=53985 RepID=A0A6A3HNB4_9STRA|nr:hypothetical protein PF009_g23405 [Phytophthora fragariae]KAE8971380.1 hypothetical protein PF011_g26054 [Phytophthora fragariae]KAE9080644.1 hypothetical protein PF007_g22970 [Phytophthora fragariae]KAE9101177.1 hypothetical protein PF006_g22730 [Phytophthora fragariae]KAE9185855.1 hypothetical protein PF005_g21085 [Phytophthora fragariae]